MFHGGDCGVALRRRWRRGRRFRHRKVEGCLQAGIIRRTVNYGDITAVGIIPLPGAFGNAGFLNNNRGLEETGLNDVVLWSLLALAVLNVSVLLWLALRRPDTGAAQAAEQGKAELLATM